MGCSYASSGNGDWGGDFSTCLLTYLIRSAETQDGLTYWVTGTSFSVTQLINLLIPPSLLVPGHAVASAVLAASYKSR
jgi:hypothetical protein